MFKKTDWQGRNSRRGESYGVPYVESLRDVRTQLTSFFAILCDGRLQSGTVQGDNAGIAAQDTNIGAWRSPVAYSLGVRVVGRSNRLAPTNFYRAELDGGD